MRATGTKVIIQPSIPPKQTSSGILLPVAYEQPSNEGLVIATGARVEDVKVGDRVAYSWIDAKDIEVDEMAYKVLDYRQLLGVFA